MPAEEQVLATYRVQLRDNFTLRDAAGIVDYLAELGISHLYCSPYLQARPGSTHGYDVVDHRRISADLGGETAHATLVSTLRAHGMGHILDVVPNHMTIAERANEWWWDVLKNGPYSDYATFFDIDWDPPEERLRRNILIPILGDHYGRVLEKGEIRLERVDGELCVRYYEHLLPVSPGAITYIFGDTLDEDEGVRRLNEDTEGLHALLELQYYRLAFWQTAGKELNYRRFFAINDLAALRVENPEVFERVHELVLQMVADGRLQGLRIDHIDGLRYPTRYLKQLRDRAPTAYICVEKILEPTEELPTEWPVEGTTGYDFLNRVGGLFVDPTGIEPLTELYRRFTGETGDVAQLKREKKLLQLDTEFGGEIERLTEFFVTVCEKERQYRDYTRAELRETLRETAAAFPVYRTYTDPPTSVRPADENYVREAIATARAARPDIDGELFDLLADILLLRVEGAKAKALAVRFQQTTGPVVAKGIEDTFFYTYNRLVSLNEVGGDPERFGVRLEEFHEQNLRAQERWPQTMLAASTHDTKRSEDVRARISLLSEMPEEWAAAVERWARMNARHKRNDLPDRNIEYLLYQTLVGAWPLGIRRATEFMQKAAREAKVHTSWIDRNPAYEAAVQGFVERVMADHEFAQELDAFVEGLVEAGWITSLAQKLLKLTAPGVPDMYQGCELWNYALVDPDNRRDVDYRERRRLLEAVRPMDAEAAWREALSGAPKMFLIRRALDLRRRMPDAFGPHGTYEPLNALGDQAHRVVGYVRGGAVVAVAPRLVMGLRKEGWGTTVLELPDGRWRDILSEGFYEGPAQLQDLTRVFPVALLAKE